MRQTEQQRRGELDFRSFHGQFVEQYLPLFSALTAMRVPLFDRLVFEGRLAAPFLEIGAELGLNGALLASRHGLRGICLDLSPDALQTGRDYRRRLGLEREALLVCADAHNLPLRNDSLATVFGWGTFHHFPDPAPVLREARRVLHPDGRFLFQEEPVRRRLSLNLYNTGTPPHELRWFERALFKLGLLPFLAVLGGRMEVQRGIHEGTFGLAELRRLLAVFNDWGADYVPQLTGGVASEGRLLRAMLTRMLGVERAFAWATRWFGGAVSGWAVKHTVGCRVLDGVPRVALVKRRDPFDVLALHFAKPAQARLINLQAAATESADQRRTLRIRLPLEMHDEVVALELPDAAELRRVDLESSRDERLFYSWRPATALPQPEQVSGILGCPSCIMATEHCLAPRCGWPCVKACATGALTQGETAPRWEPSKCKLCLECLHACPFAALDRAPLQGDPYSNQGELSCRCCNESFIIRDGIVMLLDPTARRLLDAKWR